MSYYQFTNTTLNIEEEQTINILNIGIISLFKSIIKQNNWSLNDKIIAIPIVKENPIFMFINGDLEVKMDEDEVKMDGDEAYQTCDEAYDEAYDADYKEIDERDIDYRSCYEYEDEGMSESCY